MFLVVNRTDKQCVSEYVVNAVHYPSHRHDVMEALNQQQRVLVALEKSVCDLKDGLQHSTHASRSSGRRRMRASAPPTDGPPVVTC